MSNHESTRDRSRSENRSDNRPENNIVNLGPKDSVVGTVHIEGNLNIMGRVEGEIVVNGDIVVEEGATVQASIDAHNVHILGDVVGNVTGSRRLQLSGKGNLKGDVCIGSLVVDTGATFNGAISMNTSESGSTSSDSLNNSGKTWGDSSLDDTSKSLLTDSTNGKSTPSWIEELDSPETVSKELDEKTEVTPN